MAKLIAGINMTLDGFCDHDAVTADDEVHQHYSEILRNSGAILHGRITYKLMEYWLTVLKNPTGNKAEDEFAEVINNIPKIVFSRTLDKVDWETARVAKRSLEEEVRELKKQAGKDILVGSRSLIIQCMNLSLVDELQLCVHPVIAGKGLPLFEDIHDRTKLNLLKMKTFERGAVIFYYEPVIE